MQRPDFSSLSQEQLLYIEDLEKRLNGASHLLQSLNLTADRIGTDLDHILNGTEFVKYWEDDVEKHKYNLTFLFGNKDNKTFERTMAIFDKVDKFKALAQINIEPKEEKTDKPARNLQDMVLNPQNNVS